MIPSKGISSMVYYLYIYVCTTIIVHASLFQNRRFEEIMLRFKAVEDQLKLLFTSGIAAALSSPSMSSLPLDEVVRRLQPGMISPPAVTPAPPALF